MFSNNAHCGMWGMSDGTRGHTPLNRNVISSIQTCVLIKIFCPPQLWSASNWFISQALVYA